MAVSITGVAQGHPTQYCWEDSIDVLNIFEWTGGWLGVHGTLCMYSGGLGMNAQSCHACLLLKGLLQLPEV